MIHEVRIVPLDGRPHLVPHIHQWKGDSLGRWEDQTLVVETTNFSDPTHNAGVSIGQPANSLALLGAHLKVVERFTRVDPDTITYEFTVDDPTTFMSLGLDLARQALGSGASGRGQRHADFHQSVGVHVDIVDEPQLENVERDLRVVDRRQHLNQASA